MCIERYIAKIERLKDVLALEYAAPDVKFETKLAGMTAAPDSVLARAAPAAKNWRIRRWPGAPSPGSFNSVVNELLDRIAGDRRKVSKAAYSPKAKLYRDEHRTEARTYEARWKRDNPDKIKNKEERHRAREKQKKLRGEIFAIDGEGCNTGETFCEGPFIFKTRKPAMTRHVARGELVDVLNPLGGCTSKPGWLVNPGDIIKVDGTCAEVTAKKITGDAKLYHSHRAFLFAAGNDRKIVRLLSSTPVSGPLGKHQAPVSSLVTLDWLCDLRNPFPTGIGVSYAFTYDVAQILYDLPFGAWWEIQNGKGIEWRRAPRPPAESKYEEAMYEIEDERLALSPPKSIHRKTLWVTDRADGTRAVFVINFFKGKWFECGRIDPAVCGKPGDPLPTWDNVKDKRGNYIYEKVTCDDGKKREARIHIDDVFSHFQCGFERTLKGWKKNIETNPQDFDGDMPGSIPWGKRERKDLREHLIEAIEAYNDKELIYTSRMMEALRKGLHDVGMLLFGNPIVLEKWYGPGQVAKWVLEFLRICPTPLTPAERKRGVPERKHHYQVPQANIPSRIGEPNDEQLWAHIGFSAGWIELFQQGTHMAPVWHHDLSSAYPGIMVGLPSMRDGKWRRHEAAALTHLQMKALVEKFSPLSMIHVKWSFVHPRCVGGKGDDLLWGPFFYRVGKGQELSEGSIIRPLGGEGIYYRDEFLAALDWREHYYGAGEHSHSQMTFLGAREFVPGNDIKPFAFIQRIFDERTRIITKFGEDDIRAKILKLIMNSIYGKMAQAIGGGFGGKPPNTACPWYAGAITAGTRAQMVRAGLHNPEALIMAATDALYSTGPLHGLEIYPYKILGKWEHKPAEDVGEAAIFHMPGIYPAFTILWNSREAYPLLNMNDTTI